MLKLISSHFKERGISSIALGLSVLYIVVAIRLSNIEEHRVLSTAEVIALQNFIKSHNWKLCHKNQTEVDVMLMLPSNRIALTKAHFNELQKHWDRCLASIGNTGVDTQAKVLNLTLPKS